MMSVPTDNLETWTKSPVAFTTSGVQLQSLADLYRFGTAMVKSGLVPDAYKTPEQVIVAVQFGAELGLGPMQSLQSIAVINKKPSLMVEPAMALVMRSGLLAGNEHEWRDEENDRLCSVKLQRKGCGTVTRTFAMSDANRAGLLGKGPWQTYPDRMLYARAMGFALRDLFPDVLRGIGIGEEQMDIREERNVTPTRTHAPAAQPSAIFALPASEPASVEIEPREAVEVEVMEERGGEPGASLPSTSGPSAPLPDEPAPEAPAELRAAIWRRASQTSDAHKAAPLIEDFVRQHHGLVGKSLEHMNDEGHAESLALAISTAENCRVDLRTGKVR
jgi:hypothetical protein